MSIRRDDFWVQIPGFPGYMVSESGKVIDMAANYCLIEKTTGEYNWYYLERIGVTVHTHVIKARAFIRTTSFKLHVNHIDGNKRNNDNDNLEWVTPSGNLLHAYITGLRKDNIGVNVYDVDSGKFMEFYSLTEAAKNIHTKASCLSRYLNSERISLFNDSFVVGRLTENIYELRDKIVSTFRNGFSKPVAVLDVKSNKETHYGSMSLAAKHFGVSVGSVNHYLKHPNKVFQGRKYRYLTELTGKMISQETRRYTNMNRRKPNRVRVNDLTTGRSSEYDSLEKFAIERGQKKATVQKAVYLKGRWKNYEIEYI